MEVSENKARPRKKRVFALSAFTIILLLTFVLAIITHFLPGAQFVGEELVDGKDIVITCGGGGIPVVEYKNGYKGVDAVIDKDRTSALLALKLHADVLLILTTVEKASINYKQPNEKKIGAISIKEAKAYIENKEFAEGSMLPKVEACLEFVSHSKGKKAIITSLAKAKFAIEGKTGTTIEGGN